MGIIVTDLYDGTHDSYAARISNVIVQVQSVAVVPLGQVMLTMTNVAWAKCLNLHTTGEVAVQISFDGDNWLGGGYFRNISDPHHSHTPTNNSGVYYLDYGSLRYPNIRFIEGDNPGLVSSVKVLLAT